MKTSHMELAVETVKYAKASKLFWQDVETYGSESHALRALDCKNRDEAIAMLATVQTVKIFKQDGRVILQ